MLSKPKTNIGDGWLFVLYYGLLKDYSLNMAEVKELTLKFQPDLVLIESGGDNLAANFSRELADYIIYVIDVAGSF